MTKRIPMGWLAAAAGLALAAPLSAQVLLHQDFEGSDGGWECTGGELLNSGGNPGGYLHTQFADFDWVTLRTTDARSPAIGDLTRHGGALRFTLDIEVPQLYNWFNEPMDPGLFPLVIQFVDATDPTISVYYVGPGMPSQEAGWVRYTFDVPDPSQTALPAGWGGTGDETPLGEPRLPADRTYRSVMQNVGEIHFTTAVPGYFYSSSFWEVGWDTVEMSRLSAPCYANCDGSTAAPILNVNDFSCFLNRFAAGDSSANCDGSTVAPVLNVNDFTCFLNRYAQGCP